MIIKFSFQNVLSFSKRQELSLKASAKHERLFDDRANSMDSGKDFKVLRSGVLYGANASGKSNLVKVFAQFQQYVLTGNQNLDGQEIRVPSFQLADQFANKPAVFEMECFWGGKLYRYGFRIKRTGIEEEWLYVKESRTTLVFQRSRQEFHIPAKNTVLMELTSKKMVHSKAFLVTIGAQFNDPICAGFLDWLQKLNIISGFGDRIYKDYTVRRMKESKEFARKVVDLIRLVDFGIEDLAIQSHKRPKLELTTFPQSVMDGEFGAMDGLISKRMVMNLHGQPMLKDFQFGVFESEGTQKFTQIIGPVLDALEKGNVLIIDELDTQLHSELIERIVLLFHNHQINKKNAQLIFTSNNTNLLSAKVMRRDQIFFIEKDSFGSSHFYSLVNFKKDGKSPRNDEDIEGNYLKGKYGALPYMGDFDNLLQG